MGSRLNSVLHTYCKATILPTDLSVEPIHFLNDLFLLYDFHPSHHLGFEQAFIHMRNGYVCCLNWCTSNYLVLRSCGVLKIQVSHIHVVSDFRQKNSLFNLEKMKILQVY